MVGVECVQPQTQRGMALRRKSKVLKCTVLSSIIFLVSAGD